MKPPFLKMLFLAIVVLSCTRTEFYSLERHSDNGRVTYARHPQRSHRLKVKPNQINADETVLMKTGMKTTADVRSVDSARLSQADRMISKQALCLDFRQDSLLQIIITPLTTTIGSVQEIPSGASRETAYKMKGKSIQKAPVPATAMHAAPPQHSDRRAKAGFILSLIGLIPVIGIPFSILGIIFGAIGLRDIKNDSYSGKGKGLAWAALGLGIIGLIGNIILIVVAAGSMNQGIGGNISII